MSTVPIFAPDGTLGDIPAANLAAAVKAGAKPGVHITAPDGSPGVIPADRTQDAVKAGAKLQPIEEQPAKDFWSEAGSALWNGIKAIPGGLYHAAIDPLTETHETLVNKLHQEQASDAAAESSPERQAHGSLYRNVGVPAAELVGADVRGMEQGAAEGNPGKVLGTAAVVPTAMAATAGAAKAVPAIPAATSATLDAASEVFNHPIMKALGKTTDALTFDRAGKIVDAWRKLPDESRARSANAPIPGPGAPLPETPDPALLKSQPLATGATPAVDPAKGLGEIPPQIPGVNVRPSLGRIPPEPAQIPGVNVRPNIERIKSLMDLPIPAVNQAIKELGPQAPIVTLTERANKIAALAEQGMGGKELEPNVPLKNQSSVMTPKAAATPAIPEGHTAVESSALSSYKYDPSAKEFHAKYNGSDNTVHVFGDVSPEEAQEFEAAKSKGKAMAKIKADHSPAVAKIINGQRIAVKPVVSDEDLIPNDEWQAAHELDTHVEGTPRR